MKPRTPPLPRSRDLGDLLHQHGLRATPQRQIVFDALSGRAGAHLTADAIYARVRRKSAGIDRATVYRTLYFLRDLGLVSQSEIDDQRVFEVIGERPHHHLVCQNCGTTVALDDAPVAAFVRAVRRQADFALSTPHLVLTGVCAACQRAAAAKRDFASGKTPLGGN
ncbi:MAG: transcriptional repressor [Thermoflexales bacterium]|nr:transcriptional repressor [Thermoflexales bacterium]